MSADGYEQTKSTALQSVGFTPESGNKAAVD